MQVLILSARTGWHTDELCRALIARGHQPSVAPYESLVARFGPDTSAFDVDAVLARIIPNGSLEQIIFRVDALHWIEERGIPVVNSPRAIERSVDKFYTTALLQQAGLPVPETVVCERAADAMDAIRRMLSLGGEVIIKPIFGSMGHGLVRVGDAELAWRVVRSLEQTGAVFYVQRAIDHGGRDVRLFVVGGRVLGAIERTAAPGDWRTNVARGGIARPIDPSSQLQECALAAAQAVGADYAGVDLLVSRTGDVYVLEVNGIPGWKGLQGATGLDVAAAIVQQVETRVAARLEPMAESVHV
ncbi:MAG TPA: RimK family alpha-L-glutamate ligase [Vicinamibacterales bacterium]|nr:RimK family alpha-L-glutamate ligase [Vicinamibacterales bacterium]